MNEVSNYVLKIAEYLIQLTCGKYKFYVSFSVFFGNNGL